MAEYYLISQLPSLDGGSEGTPIPITEERFEELCEEFLGKKALNEFHKLTLSPSRTPLKSNSSLIESWNEGEINLRLALGKARAAKLNKPFDTENKILPAELIKVTSTATEFESPLEAENYLANYRLNFLESLRPMDNFSEDFIFYYGLKLKLILRKRLFDKKIGEDAYRNIYDSILNGDRLEAM